MNLSQYVLDVSLKITEAKKLLSEALISDGDKEQKIKEAISLLENAKMTIYG